MSDEGKLLAALEPLTSRVRTDVTAIKSDRGMAWTREALTEVRLKRHLNGGPARGVCPIKAGESTTRVAVFDLDSHKGATPWPEMVAVAEGLCDTLRACGGQPVAFRSSGGRGVHVFLVWDEPQDAYSVREQLKEVLRGMGLKDGAAGVARGEIEIFPKQDEITLEGKGSFGNQFILPLAGKSAPLEPMLDYEVMPREYALELEWRASDPVPVVERPVREARAVTVFEGGAEIERLRGALKAIPNDGEGLGYDEWRNIIVAIHAATDGSDEGYELALEFSERSEKFEDEDELRLKVWEWADSGKQGGITADTLFFHARQAGWNDISPEDFAPLPVVQAAPGEKVELPLPNFKRDGNGKIEATVNNVRQALIRPDIAGMDLRFDEFRDEIVWADEDAPGQWMAFKDHHYFELRLRLENRGFKPIGREMIRDAVAYLAQAQSIDTASIWLDALEWDGKPRVEQFLMSFYGVDDTPYHRAVGLYMWTAMAGRVFRPGCQADMAPVFISPEQGLRKSSSIAAMVPDDTHRQLSFTQNETERARLMRGCLVAELAELQGLRTRELEEIRAWITRRYEEWTPKYREFMVRVPRRLLLIGTSNSTELFDDPVEERRFLPVRVQQVDVEGIAAARDQLWAEAKAIWLKTGVAWQQASHLVKAVYGDYRVEDTWEEALGLWAGTALLDGRVPAETGFTTREAMAEGLGFVDKGIKRADEMRAAKALKVAGFVQKVERVEGKPARIWRAVTTGYGLA